MDAKEYLDWLKDNGITFIAKNGEEGIKDIQFYKTEYLGSAKENSSYESIISYLSNVLN